jgi:hypothetical protein
MIMSIRFSNPQEAVEHAKQEGGRIFVDLLGNFIWFHMQLTPSVIMMDHLSGLEGLLATYSAIEAWIAEHQPRHYRCTRNEPYGPGCLGHQDVTARQGYYLHAYSPEHAERLMRQSFPGDDDAGFTVQFIGDTTKHTVVSSGAQN